MVAFLGSRLSIPLRGFAPIPSKLLIGWFLRNCDISMEKSHTNKSVLAQTFLWHFEVLKAIGNCNPYLLPVKPSANFDTIWSIHTASTKRYHTPCLVFLPCNALIPQSIVSTNSSLSSATFCFVFN